MTNMKFEQDKKLSCRFIAETDHGKYSILRFIKTPIGHYYHWYFNGKKVDIKPYFSRAGAEGAAHSHAIRQQQEGNPMLRENVPDYIEEHYHKQENE